MSLEDLQKEGWQLSGDIVQPKTQDSQVTSSGQGLPPTNPLDKMKQEGWQFGSEASAAQPTSTPNILEKGTHMLGEAVGSIGKYTGLPSLEGLGEDLKKSKGYMDTMKAVYGEYADIPTQLIKGLTWNYAPAAEAPASAGLARKAIDSAAYLLGMGAGVLPVTKVAGAIIPAAGIVAGIERGAAIGGVYGLGAKPEKDESRIANAAKYAAMFAAFEGAGGLIEKVATKIPEVGRVFEKIKAKEILEPSEKRIMEAVNIGRSSVLGLGAGATQPASDWQERVNNMLIGMGSFGLAHIASNVATKALRLVKESEANIPPEQKMRIDEALVNPDAPETRRRIAGQVLYNRIVTGIEKDAQGRPIESITPELWKRFVDEKIIKKEPIRVEDFDYYNEIGKRVATGEIQKKISITPVEMRTPEEQELAHAGSLRFKPSWEWDANDKMVAQRYGLADEQGKSNDIIIPLTAKPRETIKEGGITPTIERGRGVTGAIIPEISKEEIARAKAQRIITGKPMEAGVEVGVKEPTKEPIKVPAEVKEKKKTKTELRVEESLRKIVGVEPAKEPEVIKEPIKESAKEPEPTKIEAEKPEKILAKDKLKPAINKDGEIFTGTNHNQIRIKSGIQPTEPHTEGFLRPDGKFIKRADASAWVEKNQPNVWDKLSADSKKSLHSEDYVKALKEVNKLAKKVEVPTGVKPYEGLIPGTKEWMKVWKENLNLQKEMAAYAKEPKKEVSPITRIGPGGMTREAAEKETPPSIDQIHQALKSNLKDNVTRNIDQEMSLAQRLAQQMSKAPGLHNKSVEGLKGMWVAIKNRYKDNPTVSDFKGIIGENMAMNTKTSLKVVKLAKDIVKALPNRIGREAIFNYIEAGGDEAYMRDALKLTIDKYRKGWQAALRLTPQEKLFTENVKQYFDSMLQEAIDAGMLKDGVTDYIMRIVKPDSKIGRRWQAEVNAGLLKKDPTFIRRRMFETILEGERAGIDYVKDVGQSIVAYAQSFYRAISARKTIRDLLHSGVASDGKPLATIIGGNIKVERGETPDAYIIKPRMHPDNAFDAKGNPYMVIDHPALREWKWITNDATGKPIIMQGDVAVHPEIYQHLKNILGTSVIRQSPLGKGVLTAVREFKSTLLSLSGFHQVQEALHALFHKVLPWDLPELDMENKTQYALVKGGLMIYDQNGMEKFGEGVAATGLIQRLPIVGGMFYKYNNYLFTDWIPRLKMKMALAALERNVARYSGTHTQDAIYYKTASQANAAFGELNYKMMGRNQTFQDALRLMTLAPDFLEARTRFVTQALRPGGQEQLYALARGAIGLVMLTKIVNTVLDGDPHWEKPLSFVVGSREFMLRSVPGDLYHLASDPRSFIYHRLNPTATRTLVESITGRDFLGRKRNFTEQVKDFVTTHIPIPLQAPAEKLFNQRDRKIWESALNSLGMQTYDYHSLAEGKARQLMLDRGPFTYTEHSKKVNDLLRKLDKETITHRDIEQAYANKEISRDDYRRILKEHSKTNIIRSIEYLELSDIKEVWDKMTDAEKVQTKSLIRKKMYNRWRKVTPEERNKLRPFMQEVQ